MAGWVAHLKSLGTYDLGQSCFGSRFFSVHASSHIFLIILTIKQSSVKFSYFSVVIEMWPKYDVGLYCNYSGENWNFFSLGCIVASANNFGQTICAFAKDWKSKVEFGIFWTYFTHLASKNTYITLSV